MNKKKDIIQYDIIETKGFLNKFLGKNVTLSLNFGFKNRQEAQKQINLLKGYNPEKEYKIKRRKQNWLNKWD